MRERPGIDLLQLVAVHDGTGQKRRIARLLDADLARHLTGDDLDVLIVDVTGLRAVDLLDFLDKVCVHLVQPLDAHNVGRCLGAFGQGLTDLPVATARRIP